MKPSEQGYLNKYQIKKLLNFNHIHHHPVAAQEKLSVPELQLEIMSDKTEDWTVFDGDWDGLWLGCKSEEKKLGVGSN